jgi:hypothetical protein
MQAKVDIPSYCDEPLLNLFAKNDGFWWPHRSLAKALLCTQENASAYVEANRKLLDEMRAIVRKEQDLALEISQKALEAVAENGSSKIPDGPEVNAVFERAINGLRALGEDWMNAQLRSLDVMRSHAALKRKSHTIRRAKVPVSGSNGHRPARTRRSGRRPAELRAGHS